MIVKNMKAAILMESNEPLVVAEIEMPNKLQYGQVLVELFYSGICGAQINEIEAAKGPDKFLPHLLGHEGSGVVLDVGPGVTTVQKGDHVVMHWRPGDGIESQTPQYRWNDNDINAGWVTTFNEFAVVSENRITSIPKDFDLKLAPLLGCAVTTAIGVVNNDACVKIGESVVIFGVGGVGLLIAQAASMVSAYPIVGVDKVESKLKMCKDFGVTHTLLSSDDLDNNNKMIKDIVGSKGADVVVDTTGIARVIECAYELTHPDGKTILVGVPRKGDNINIYSLPLHFNKILTGSEGGNCRPNIDIPRYIKLYEVGKLNFNGLVTHEFDLDNVNEAIDMVRSGESGRCMIKLQ